MAIKRIADGYVDQDNPFIADEVKREAALKANPEGPGILRASNTGWLDKTTSSVIQRTRGLPDLAAGLGNYLVGDQAAAQNRIQRYQENDAFATALGPDVQDFSQVKDATGALSAVGYNVAKMVPDMIGGLGIGALVGKGARTAAEKYAVKAIGSRLMAREGTEEAIAAGQRAARRKLVKEAEYKTLDRAGKAAARENLDAQTRGLAENAVADYAGKVAARAGAGQTAGKVGFAAGATAANVPANLQDQAQFMADHPDLSQSEAWRLLAGTTVAASTDFLPMARFMGRFGKKGVEQALSVDKFAKRLAKETGGQFLAEGSQEAGQAFITKASQKWVDENVNLMDKAAFEDYAMNFIAGGIVGGTMGAAGEVGTTGARKVGEVFKSSLSRLSKYAEEGKARLAEQRYAKAAAEAESEGRPPPPPPAGYTGSARPDASNPTASTANALALAKQSGRTPNAAVAAVADAPGDVAGQIKFGQDADSNYEQMVEYANRYISGDPEATALFPLDDTATSLARQVTDDPFAIMAFGHGASGLDTSAVADLPGSMDALGRAFRHGFSSELVTEQDRALIGGLSAASADPNRIPNLLAFRELQPAETFEGLRQWEQRQADEQSRGQEAPIVTGAATDSVIDDTSEEDLGDATDEDSSNIGRDGLNMGEYFDGKSIKSDKQVTGSVSPAERAAGIARVFAASKKPGANQATPHDLLNRPEYAEYIQAVIDAVPNPNDKAIAQKAWQAAIDATGDPEAIARVNQIPPVRYLTKLLGQKATAEADTAAVTGLFTKQAGRESEFNNRVADGRRKPEERKYASLYVPNRKRTAAVDIGTVFNQLQYSEEQQDDSATTTPRDPARQRISFVLQHILSNPAYDIDPKDIPWGKTLRFKNGQAPITLPWRRELKPMSKAQRRAMLKASRATANKTYVDSSANQTQDEAVEDGETEAMRASGTVPGQGGQLDVDRTRAADDTVTPRSPLTRKLFKALREFQTARQMGWDKVQDQLDALGIPNATLIKRDNKSNYFIVYEKGVETTRIHRDLMEEKGDLLQGAKLSPMLTVQGGHAFTRDGKNAPFINRKRVLEVAAEIIASKLPDDTTERARNIALRKIKASLVDAWAPIRYRDGIFSSKNPVLQKLINDLQAGEYDTVPKALREQALNPKDGALVNKPLEEDPDAVAAELASKRSGGPKVIPAIRRGRNRAKLAARQAKADGPIKSEAPMNAKERAAAETAAAKVRGDESIAERAQAAEKEYADFSRTEALAEIERLETLPEKLASLRERFARAKSSRLRNRLQGQIDTAERQIPEAPRRIDFLQEEYKIAKKTKRPAPTPAAAKPAAPTGYTPDKVRTVLEGMFGKTVISKMISRGMLKLTESDRATEWWQREGGTGVVPETVQGWASGAKITIVSDRIDSDDILHGLFVHEITHSTLPVMLGKKLFARLSVQVFNEAVRLNRNYEKNADAWQVLALGRMHSAAQSVGPQRIDEIIAYSATINSNAKGAKQLIDAAQLIKNRMKMALLRSKTNSHNEYNEALIDEIAKDPDLLTDLAQQSLFDMMVRVGAGEKLSDISREIDKEAEIGRVNWHAIEYAVYTMKTNTPLKIIGDNNATLNMTKQEYRMFMQQQKGLEYLFGRGKFSAQPSASAAPSTGTAMIPPPPPPPGSLHKLTPEQFDEVINRFLSPDQRAALVDLAHTADAQGGFKNTLRELGAEAYTLSSEKRQAKTIWALYMEARNGNLERLYSSEHVERASKAFEEWRKQQGWISSSMLGAKILDDMVDGKFEQIVADGMPYQPEIELRETQTGVGKFADTLRDATDTVRSMFRSFMFNEYAQAEISGIAAWQDWLHALHVRSGARLVIDPKTGIAERGASVSMQERTTEFLGKLNKAAGDLSPTAQTAVLRELYYNLKAPRPGKLNPAETAAFHAIRAVYKEMATYGQYYGVLGKLRDNYTPVIFDVGGNSALHKAKLNKMFLLGHNKPLWRYESMFADIYELATKGIPDAPAFDKLSETDVRAFVEKTVNNAFYDANDLLLDNQMGKRFKFAAKRLFQDVYTQAKATGNYVDVDILVSTLEPSLAEHGVRYVEPLVAKAEEARLFPDKGPDSVAGRIDTMRKQGATEDQIASAERAHDAVFGRVSFPEFDGKKGSAIIGAINERLAVKMHTRGTLRTMQNVGAWNNLRLLPLALLASIADPGGITVRNGGDLGSTFKAMKDMVKSIYDSDTRDALMDFAESVEYGAELEAAAALNANYGAGSRTPAARRVNNFVFKWNGMQWLTKWSRLSTLQAANTFLVKQQNYARGSDKAKSEQARRYFEELGLKVDDVRTGEIKTGPLAGRPTVLLLSEVQKASATDAQLQADARVKAAIRQFTDEAILRPDSLQTPGWHNDPFVKLITQYKAFTYAIYEQITRRAILEIDNGNWGVLSAAMVYLPMLMFGELLRELIKNGGAGDPKRADWGPGQYAALAAGKTGLAGPQGELISSVSTDLARGNVPGKSYVGPTVGYASEVAAASSGRRDWGTTLVRAAPASAAWAKWGGQNGGETVGKGLDRAVSLKASQN